MDAQKQAFEDTVEQEREQLENKQEAISWKADQLMEKLGKVQDYLNDVDGLPLDEVVAEGVRRVKYDTRTVTVVDYNTWEAVENATIEVYQDNYAYYTTDANGEAGPIDFSRDYTYIIITAEGYSTLSTDIIEDVFFLHT
jgi:hypothetical protein